MLINSIDCICTSLCPVSDVRGQYFFIYSIIFYNTLALLAFHEVLSQLLLHQKCIFQFNVDTVFIFTALGAINSKPRLGNYLPQRYINLYTAGHVSIVPSREILNSFLIIWRHFQQVWFIRTTEVVWSFHRSQHLHAMGSTSYIPHISE